MGYTSEIRGTLGMDTNSFRQDLDGARQSFKKFGHDIQNESHKTGEGAGEKLGEALEHKLFGSRHVAGALATALGLNLEKIAEKIAQVIVGGTKEGMEEALKIEERLSKALDVADERRLTTAQKIQHVENEIAAKKREAGEFGSHTEIEDVKDSQGATMFKRKVEVKGGGTNLTEEESNKQRTLFAQIVEDQNKLNALKDGQKSKDESFHEKERSASRAALTDEQEMIDLENDLRKLGETILNKKNTEAEIDAARLKILEKTGAISALQLKIDEKKIENSEKIQRANDTENAKIKEFNDSQMDDAERLGALQDELLAINKKISAEKLDSVRLADLINQKTEKEISLAKELANVRKREGKEEKKSDDQDKLGIDELAQLGPHQFRVSSKTADEAGQAREALRLKQQAEDARKLGNSDQSEELRTRSESIRSGLTSLKSGDRGMAPQLTQALVPTNVLLASIDKTLGNKFVNQ